MGLELRVVKDDAPAILPWIVLNKYGNPIARFLEEDDAHEFANLKRAQNK